MPPPDGCTAIVTNPPYSQKDAFLRRAYELGLPWFMLLPITAIEGKRRQALYAHHGVSLYLPRGRIEFGKGGVWFYTAWFFWIPGEGNTILFADTPGSLALIPPGTDRAGLPGKDALR